MMIKFILMMFLTIGWSLTIAGFEIPILPALGMTIVMAWVAGWMFIVTEILVEICSKHAEE